MSFLPKEIILAQLRHILPKDPRALILNQFRFNILQWLFFSDSTEPTASLDVYARCKAGG